MTLLQRFLHLTNFRSPFLRTLVPSVSAVFAIQTAVAIPSILAQSERFYDFSGSVTFIAVSALSLYLPALRARYASQLVGGSTAPLPSLLSPFMGSPAAGVGVFNWRQVVLSAAVTIWATRLGSYLFQRILQEGHDSRFEEIRKSRPKFLGAFTAQATWVSLCSLPVIAVNSIPAAALSSGVKPSDVLGLGLYVGGIVMEVMADRQKAKWMQEKRDKVHDEQFLTRGLWSRSRHPNYFGETTLWTGIATTAAGVLLSKPVQIALGLNTLSYPRLAALGMCYVSPAFVTFLLLKVSGVPLSESKYDKRYGDRKDYQEWKQNTPKFFPKLFQR
ncbi:hypothetical protein QBC46DRAFT_430332 [Diplogelasinospora grovesii]|uniref:Steroid 5-alpha reductase C-terminal domain-containing protein n=1 Tax=Diplogelasinospora grovesii TaxID=303347 RepID=A0AAN6S958_9PEZI|nr:hypothetical protein QBC46DRAFT_430332 [Diplogelasinospora grovesii]